jgi:hypothetical protein
MDDEFKSAITKFLHSWIRPEFLAEHGEEGFEQVFHVAVNGNIGSMFRSIVFPGKTDFRRIVWEREK